LLHHQRKRFASVTEDDIHTCLLQQTGLVDVVEHDIDTQSLYESDAAGSLCWWCALVIRNKSKAVPKSLIEFGKGKSCMTSLGVTDDDMPNPHSLVANYARMLVEDRPRFVETLFRAVKLDKLDVTKILCKIAQVFIATVSSRSEAWNKYNLFSLCILSLFAAQFASLNAYMAFSN